ncbi:MAG: phospho-N-acetylmuramoyl-pentapeptide-transferase [Candidatus Nomurabacteria bacterium]|nr:MAG: phospho-N-acetylmuramoyl-pentapeptide-transferase [Candidatus Nomurabacteria bacterium]
MFHDTFSVLKVFSLATLAFIVTILWTPLLTSFLYRHKLGKQIRSEDSAPIYAKMHQAKSGTPTMGGMLIWVTTLVIALVIAWIALLSDFDFFKQLNFLTRSETLLPLGALIATALVGLLDDYYNVRKMGANGGGLRVRHKLIIYTAIAIVGAWWFVAKLDWTTMYVPFLGNYDLGWWFAPIIVFLIVATSFSVNETDGLDGLAGGTLLACFAVFGLIAFSQGSVDLATFCAVISGALLAFLWFNIHPARFFMGDTGSMSLGTTLAIVAILTNAVYILPIIGFVFVAEALSVIIQLSSKKIRKKKVFLSTPLHHHFEAIGWPETKIVMRFWVLTAVMAVLGLSFYLFVQ